MTKSMLLGDGKDSVCLNRCLRRLEAVQQASERKISQKDAAEKLGITARHNEKTDQPLPPAWL